MVFYWEVVDEKLKIDIYGEKIAPFGLYRKAHNLSLGQFDIRSIPSIKSDLTVR